MDLAARLEPEPVFGVACRVLEESQKCGQIVEWNRPRATDRSYIAMSEAAKSYMRRDWGRDNECIAMSVYECGDGNIVYMEMSSREVNVELWGGE